jgi:hypothetical protein
VTGVELELFKKKKHVSESTITIVNNEISGFEYQSSNIKIEAKCINT